MRVDRAVARVAGRQHGVVATPELRAFGMSAKAVMSRVRRGSLHPQHRGVYAVGHARLTQRGRWMAAVKACGPTAALSHLSAAMLLGFVEERTHVPHVTVLGSWARRHGGIEVHRSERVERAMVDGIPVTTPARTLIDLAATDPERLRRATNEALAAKRVTIGLLMREVRRNPGRRGVARLRATLATAAPTRSELEDAFLAFLDEHDFERPEVNRRLRAGDRWLVPDFRWPTERLVVETDGDRWHDTAIARHDDRIREEALIAGGERVVRVAWHELWHEPQQTRARLTDAGAPSKYAPPRS